MRIVIDTNVFISSTFWEGNSDKIMKKVENQEIQLLLSKEIIDEFIEVLEYKEILDKIKDKHLEMRRTIEKVISISKIVEPITKLDIIKEDNDDNIILECAVEGNADFIVSHDKHLLKLEEYQGIKIVTPENFLIITSLP